MPLLFLLLLWTTVIGIGIIYFEKSKNDKLSSTQNVANQSINHIPNIKIYDEENKEYNLHQLVSKPTLILVWASWCPYCQRQLPEIKALYEKYKDKVDFILIDALSEKENKEMAKDNLDKNNINIKNYFSDTVLNDLALSGQPAIYITSGIEIKHFYDKNQDRVTLENDLLTTINHK